MKKLSLPRTLSKTEFRWGIVYLIVHVLVLPWLLGMIGGLLIVSGIEISNVSINAVYLLIGFTVLLIIFRRYLMENFEHFIFNPAKSLVIIVIGIIVYFIANVIFDIVITIIAGGDLSSPNNDAVTSMVKSALYPSIALTVLLAPVVEEILYRGVLFSGIGAKSKFWGYLLSTVLFAFSHVYQAMIYSFDPMLFLTMALYLPSGLVLANIYERSGTIWCPIIVHMAINFTVVLANYYLI